jgi:hypothetical protein
MLICGTEQPIGKSRQASLLHGLPGQVYSRAGYFGPDPIARQ